MNAKTKKKLEDAGWVVAHAGEFLELKGYCEECDKVFPLVDIELFKDFGTVKAQHIADYDTSGSFFSHTYHEVRLIRRTGVGE